MYFETHAHYDDNRFKNDRDEVLEDLKNSGVDYVINSASNMRSSKIGIELTKKYPFIYCSVGTHPHDAKQLQEKDMDILRSYSKEKKVVAIGEIGLDFYYDHSERDVQRYWFKKQLSLANEVNLPVIIHSREADQECFDIIKEANINKKGVIHCYSGSSELAKEYIKLGYYIGVGGVITFPNSVKLVKTVKEIPIEKIFIETDSPYLSPAPNRGKRNDSRNLKYIVQRISEIKNIPIEDVCRITSENAVTFFL